MGTVQTKAKNKYNTKTYDHVNLMLPRGTKDRIRAYADRLGISINAYITMAIKAQMATDDTSNTDVSKKEA